MGSVMNGMTLHGGVRPYGGTFLIFSDYMRPPIRLASLMELPVVYIFTHDSVGLGEDGPTHQPIEQLSALRAIPGLVDLRPGDAAETAEAWRFVMEYDKGPAFMALTRQALPHVDRERFASADGLRRGGYILAEADGGAPRLIIIATGSELSIALSARETLQSEGIATRVVSMPSCVLFDRQPAEYRAEVLPPEVRARIAIEAASPHGWHRWVGLDGEIIGISRFGESAPAKKVFEELGISLANLVSRGRALVGRGAVPAGLEAGESAAGPARLGVDE
jgi:transketolase